MTLEEEVRIFFHNMWKDFDSGKIKIGDMDEYFLPDDLEERVTELIKKKIKDCAELANKIFIWLGANRDKMPADLVRSLQDLADRMKESKSES